MQQQVVGLMRKLRLTENVHLHSQEIEELVESQIAPFMHSAQRALADSSLHPIRRLKLEFASIQYVEQIAALEAGLYFVTLPEKAREANKVAYESFPNSRIVNMPVFIRGKPLNVCVVLDQSPDTHLGLAGQRYYASVR